jgi:hypothetical protein
MEYLLRACPNDGNAKPAAALWPLRRQCDVPAEWTEGDWKRESSRSP